MQEIHITMVLEILGRPKEHIIESLDKIIEKLGTEKGVKLIKKIVHDPIPVEGSDDLLTTFAEIELKLDSLSVFFGIMFAYMPSNVEIIEPVKSSVPNTELTELINHLLQRLHNYDSIAKKLIADQQFLLEKIKHLSPEEYNKLVIKENKPEN